MEKLNPAIRTASAARMDRQRLREGGLPCVKRWPSGRT
jgi:hypothetical protein